MVGVRAKPGHGALLCSKFTVEREKVKIEMQPFAPVLQFEQDPIAGLCSPALLAAASGTSSRPASSLLLRPASLAPPLRMPSRREAMQFCFVSLLEGNMPSAVASSVGGHLARAQCAGTRQ